MHIDEPEFELLKYYYSKLEKEELEKLFDLMDRKLVNDNTINESQDGYIEKIEVFVPQDAYRPNILEDLISAPGSMNYLNHEISANYQIYPSAIGYGDLKFVIELALPVILEYFAVKAIDKVWNELVEYFKYKNVDVKKHIREKCDEVEVYLTIIIKDKKNKPLIYIEILNSNTNIQKVLELARNTLKTIIIKDNKILKLEYDEDKNEFRIVE